MTVTLEWTRTAPSSWNLRTPEGSRWGYVAKSVDYKGRYIAMCVHPGMPSPVGGNHWSIHSNVNGARRAVESWIHRNACAVENYTIA